jgi:hypothetical protein
MTVLLSTGDGRAAASKKMVELPGSDLNRFLKAMTEDRKQR